MRDATVLFYEKSSVCLHLRVLGFVKDIDLAGPPASHSPARRGLHVGPGGVSDCPAGKVVLPSAFQGLCTHQVSSAHQVLTEQVLCKGPPRVREP